MIKPKLDFIGIGAPKAGTTWLHRCLGEHPDICVSHPKELPFFKPDGPKPNLATYTEHLSHCGDEKISGEWTPFYLHSEEMADFLRKHFPNAKLLVALRDPTERYISAYYFHLKRGDQPYPSIEEKFDADLEDAKNGKENTLTRGKYYGELQKYWERFPADQFHYIFYGDLRSNPQETLGQLYAFLGVDASYTPAALTKKKPKRSAAFRSLTLQRALFYLRNQIVRFPKLKEAVVSIGGHHVIRAIRNHNIRHNEGDQGASPELVTQLKSYYVEDIQLLEHALKRDLSTWK